MSQRMHFLSRLGPKALAAFSLLVTQGVAQSVAPPNLDFSSLGQVAVAGNFDTISVYSQEGQQELFHSNGTQSILSFMSNGGYDMLASTDAAIQAMCPFVLKDGTFAGLVVAGNFTSIGNTNARSIAMFNPSTMSITALPGIQGSISSLLCDRDTESVYVGGAFEAASSANAIAWIAAGAWANLPFAGFDAPVTSITKAPNGHVVFGGSFTGLGNHSTTTQTNRQSQAISLSSADVTAGGTTTQAGYSDPRNLVCPSNGTDSPSTTWLLEDKTPGYWLADFNFGFEPTKLRLWNTNVQGRGTKTWRFTALPLGGIINMTYTDPETGKDAYCDATCPLSHNSSNPYQDFTFVSDAIGMNSFRIDISDWYGDGGGLDGIELFQNDIFTYAVEAFNEPKCLGSDTPATVTATGSWYRTPARQSVADYLAVVVGPASVDTTSVVFQPDVREGGNYSVIIYTPGCLQDSSCSARAIVNVTGTLTSGASPSFSTQIFQTNDFDKYDQIFQGQIDASSSSFRPSITITPSGLQEAQMLVASRIKLGFTSSSGGLNGLFDFDPNQAVVDLDFSKSAINNAGTTLHPNAHVQAMTTHDQTLYVAGKFSDDVYDNIMAFSNNKASSLPGGGLNAAVSALYSLNDFLYVGGNFTGTNTGNIQGMNNLGAYQYSKNSWVALGAGVDGAVTTVVPIQVNVTQSQAETAIAFSGSFTQVQSSGSAKAQRADGLAIWVPSRNAWLQNLDIPKQALAGKLSTAVFLPNNTWLGAGNLASLGQAISGAVGLQSASGNVNLQQLPIQIKPASSQSSLQKRASATQQNVNGISTVAYYNDNDLNITILGGHFSAQATNGSTIQNLLLLNGTSNNAVTGLATGIDNNSTIFALSTQGNTLCAGGSVSGKVSGVQIDGMFLYDLQQAEYRTIQPAALVGPDVIVNAIAPQPGTSGVYVGGSFERTSQDLSCPSVCMYDTSLNQWNSVGSGLDGPVISLFWTSSTTLLAAGNLTINGNDTSLATYDSKKQTWSAMQSSAFPGPITAFAPATSNADHMWVSGIAKNGSTYLMEVDGDNYRPVINMFDQGTTIHGLQILKLNKEHGSSQYLDKDQALLVTGQLKLSNFGPASAAVFNGTAMAPLILASTASGEAGTISQLFSSNTNPLKSSNHHHSRGIVVLIALCAALGTIFLLILIGIILNRIQRRRNGYNAVPTVAYHDKHSNISRVPPEKLFGTLGQKNGAPTV